MKVIILAGGLGTRISEESYLKPKPMIEIGDQPILWHIMKYYSSFGFHDFIICCGYKGHVIKEYFADYYLHRPSERGRALAGDFGGHRADDPDRRAGETGAKVHWGRALHAHLWRRGG